jgi:hypothetical protein
MGLLFSPTNVTVPVAAVPSAVFTCADSVKFWARAAELAGDEVSWVDVRRSGVAVGVAVGGTAVDVGVGVGVAVGGTGVDMGIAVGVAMGGTGVDVGVAVSVAVGGTGEVGKVGRRSTTSASARYKTATAPIPVERRIKPRRLKFIIVAFPLALSHALSVAQPNVTKTSTIPGWSA